jgi:hypothetical protein
MTRVTFTIAAVAFLSVTAAAAPPPTYESGTELQPNIHFNEEI